MSDEQAEAKEVEAHDSGDQAVEAEAPSIDYEARAREMGWADKDEWRGDPDKWRPAEEFVRRGEEFLPIVQAQLRKEREANDRIRREYEKRMERLEATSEAAFKRQQEAYERELKAIDARMKQAREEGDADMVYRLAERKGELSANAPEVREQPKPGPAPEVQEWIAENQWFLAHPEAQAVANIAATRAKQAGGDIRAELAAAEKAARQRFPELFPDSPKPVVRAVDGGGSAPPPAAKRAKGWADIPAADRQAIERAFLRDDRFVQNLGGPEKARAAMASDYWSQ